MPEITPEMLEQRTTELTTPRRGVTGAAFTAVIRSFGTMEAGVYRYLSAKKRLGIPGHTADFLADPLTRILFFVEVCRES